MKYVVGALLGGGLLLFALRVLQGPPASQHQHQPSSTTESSTTDTMQQDNHTPTTGTPESADRTPVESQTEQPTENNPLKRFQDLVNSPTTPDGHKVVAAVAAASTVTVAAVANWLMKATKK